MTVSSLKETLYYMKSIKVINLYVPCVRNSSCKSEVSRKFVIFSVKRI